MRIMQTRKRAAAVGAAALGLAVALGVLAPAAGACTTTKKAPVHVSVAAYIHRGSGSRYGFHGVGLTGTITATTTGSFTLLHGAKSYTVDELASTKVREAGQTGLTVADLNVNDHVRVTGRRTSTAGTIDAFVVTIVVFPPYVNFSGSVSGKSASSFTVVGHGGITRTVDVTSSSAFSEPGQTGVTFSDLAIGDEVDVIGQSTATAGTFDALAVVF